MSEFAAVCRATIKKPDILILDGALASLDAAIRDDLHTNIRKLLPDATIICLARKQLRLLAFGSRWYQASAGDYVFRQGDDPSTGIFLVMEGTAELLDPRQIAENQIITTSMPGDLVGELGLNRGVPRALDRRAATDLTCLRIGAESFFDVVETDSATAYRLLQVVVGYV